MVTCNEHYLHITLFVYHTICISHYSYITLFVYHTICISHQLYITLFVYHTITPLGGFSMLDISTDGINVGANKGLGVGKHPADSFPKTCRSVLAPSWFVEQSILENRPPGCV